MQAIFFTDLDNTAIYSHRHVIEEPLVWVEELNGQPQSFMTKKYYDYFSRQDWLRVIPLTSRTAAQYLRLCAVSAVMKWEDALVYNGAVLLRNGVEDMSWREESLRLSQADQAAFQALWGKVEALYPAEAIENFPGFMFYIKTDETGKVFELMNGLADPAHVRVYKDSRKVYCQPASLSKGNALRRYMNMCQNAPVLAAGDSEFDISMLEQADICLCPESLSGQVNAAGEKIVCRGLFSDAICDAMENIRIKGEIW